ncbi:MAG: hypothetical protein U0822_25050 [Anaerolineae bacterium]
MDFFEQWFGISPDGGNGSLELLYLAVIIAIILIFVFRKQIAAMIREWRGQSRR